MPIKINTTDFFQIIGIKTNNSDYKTAWILNSLFNINFTKLILKSDEFSIYSTLYKNKTIFLIENIIPGKKLFNDLKEFNFILKIIAENNFVSDILNEIKNSKEFDFIGIIQKNKISKKTLDSISNINS